MPVALVLQARKTSDALLAPSSLQGTRTITLRAIVLPGEAFPRFAGVAV